MPTIRQPLVRALAAAYGGVETIKRATRSAELFLQGFALSALQERERGALTTACYARANKPIDLPDLFHWEREWFQRDLPPPPARLLLGGAGLGRELKWLTHRGYEVVAFDPVASAASPTGAIVVADYESLLDAKPTAAVREIQRQAPYAAVILGWGSFSHVSDPSKRGHVLQALKQLCTGPVLASFWRPTMDEPSPPGRAERFGARAGRLLSKRSAAPSDGFDSVLPHCGYGRQLGPKELQTLAAQAAYRLVPHAGPYGHATLWPEVEPGAVSDKA